MADATSKYGTDIENEIIAEDSSTPIRSAIVEQRGQLFLDVRRMYMKDGELQFGKGCRIPLEGGVAEEFLEVATQMVLKHIVIE